MSTIKNNSRQWILGAVMVLLFNTVAMTQAKSDGVCTCGLINQAGRHACDDEQPTTGSELNITCKAYCEKKPFIPQNSRLRNGGWKPDQYYGGGAKGTALERCKKEWCAGGKC